MNRFVAVIGTVNHDLIVDADGRRLESLGGILYNVVALAAVLEGTGVGVRPYGRLGAADREEALRILAAFPAAEPGGLVADPAGTNRSVLDYSGPGDRLEEVEMRVAPLSPSDLAGAEEAEAVLVNMISGRDVSRSTLERLRAHSRALFLLDIQALARTLEAPRRPRAVPDWEVWCPIFDVVRGNEEEVGHFSGAPGDLREAMRRILAAGAGEVLATRGARGCRRGTLEGRELRIEEIPAFPARGAADPTGCGDSFLSGVCAGRVLGLTPGGAGRLGSYVASEVASLSGLGSLDRLRGVLGRAARHVPRLAPLRTDPPPGCSRRP